MVIRSITLSSLLSGPQQKHDHASVGDRNLGKQWLVSRFGRVGGRATELGRDPAGRTLLGEQVW